MWVDGTGGQIKRCGEMLSARLSMEVLVLTLLYVFSNSLCCCNESQ